ncbi:urea transporter [Microbacterium resistens]|uniref:Urea transporter n=1 Tax=Microbacterium resistens TaxID=156977 RepID=A0ABU1S823_9MICO|nr:PLDc N-terminal domain-containing protein [Microbacterium resistens]MDR6865760.1 urea transporter [Microbacterium resistens]
MHNPLIPTAYDVFMVLIALLIVVYGVVAFVSILRTRRVEALTLIFWFVVVLAVPVLGPTAWFLIGRPAARGRVHAQKD